MCRQSEAQPLPPSSCSGAITRASARHRSQKPESPGSSVHRRIRTPPHDAQLAADIGGAAELVRHGENGLVFEAGGVAALVAAMKRACDEKGAWPGRSKAARRSVEGLTEERHAERLVALYEEKDPALAHRGPVVPIRYQAKPTGAYTGR